MALDFALQLSILFFISSLSCQLIVYLIILLISRLPMAKYTLSFIFLKLNFELLHFVQ